MYFHVMFPTLIYRTILIFTSVQARKLNHSVCFSFPHKVGYFVGTPFIARRCVSNQVGRRDAVCQGCPRRVSQPAVLSALLVIQLFGIVIPPHISLEERQKKRCGHYSVATPLHYFSWCAPDYFVVSRSLCRNSRIPSDLALVNIASEYFSSQ